MEVLEVTHGKEKSGPLTFEKSRLNKFKTVTKVRNLYLNIKPAVIAPAMLRTKQGCKKKNRVANWVAEIEKKNRKPLFYKDLRP